MTDERPPAPGQGICGFMRYVSEGGELKSEICTFPAHNKVLRHFFEDFQQYYDRIMAEYDTMMLTPETYTSELKAARQAFLQNIGERFQQLQEAAKKTWTKDSDPDVPEPPATRMPPLTKSPPSGKYPPLRVVKDGEATQELGICGASERREGEWWICVAQANHLRKGKDHDWRNYEDAVEDAERLYSRTSWWSRRWWKDKLDQLFGRGNEELPPPSGQGHPSDPDRWQNDPEGSRESASTPDYPSRPETPEEERRKPFDPEHGGGHVGSRGPGTEPWDTARRAGANWEEPDDGATRTQDPSGEPIPPHATGTFAGAPFRRRRDTSNPDQCGRYDKKHGKIYICRRRRGHELDELPCIWTYLRDADEND